MVTMEISSRGGGDLFKANLLEEKYELEFPGGGMRGAKQKTFQGEGECLWAFPQLRTLHSESFLKL